MICIRVAAGKKRRKQTNHTDPCFIQSFVLTTNMLLTDPNHWF